MTREEKLLKAKIPCAETGIEIKHTICDICTPGVHCGVDAYVKDGKLLKIEGTKGFPPNKGALCVKGATGRQYATREDRIKDPMKRVGPRGSEKFVPISWDEAFELAAAGLNGSKAKYGPEATAFVSGYTKWYRTFLHRLAYSFGSPNYMTESSTCWQSVVMASRCVFGHMTMADLMGTKLLLIWGNDPFTKNIHQSEKLHAIKERGGKIIVIDPRRNAAAEQLADLYLRPKAGYDIILASAMANHMIKNDLIDKEFIENRVHGYEEYREYVSQFDLKTAEAACNVPADKIALAAEMFATTKPASISTGTGITQKPNGFNASRALLSLAAICGQFDKPGTLKPGTTPPSFCYMPGGFFSKEKEFISSVRPKTDLKPVGLENFPLFVDMINEAQAMDLTDQVLTGEPYPIKSAFLVGVNHMMYPDSPKFIEAIQSMDFVAASDIFWTETCRNADIVFPACTSYERGEIKCYMNKLIYYTQPAIPPMYNSRPDTDIFFGLARALGLDDDLMCSDYDTCARYILEESSGIEDWEAFKYADKPIPAPKAVPYEWGTVLKRGPRTPTGKIELYSELIAAYNRPELDPLPVHTSPFDDSDPDIYNMTLFAGTRNYNSIHSRLQKCEWARSLRPYAAVDINPEDARRLGIEQGDIVEVATPVNSITVRANLTLSANTGELHMGHGYEEANVSQLLNRRNLDPYTGFPSYKQLRCRIEKKAGAPA